MSTYLISGAVTEAGTPVSGAQVLLMTRDSPARVLQRQTTNGSGIYQFSGLVNATEYAVMVLDPSGGTSYNAIVYDKVTPVSGSSVDANWDSTVLLLGNDGLPSLSQLITDLSSKYRVVLINKASNGQPAYSTTSPPTGLTSAINFDGIGYLDFVTSADFAFGTGDFTIETWAYSAAFNAGTKVQWDSRLSAGAGEGLLLYTNGSNLIAHWTGATRITGTLPSNSTWTHLAFTRESGNCKLWLAGTQTGSTVANAVNFSSSTEARVGSDIANGTSTFNGRVAGFRVTKGVARYTATFTPPSLPLTSN